MQEIKYFTLTDDQKKQYPKISQYLNENPIACGWYIKNKYISFSEKEYSFQELQNEYYNHINMMSDRKILLEKKRADNKAEPLVKKLI